MPEDKTVGNQTEPPHAPEKPPGTASGERTGGKPTAGEGPGPESARSSSSRSNPTNGGPAGNGPSGDQTADSDANGRSEDSLHLQMLDGAEPTTPTLPPEYEAQRSLAADASLPLVERLEAFEDIFESEVGDTSLSRARNLEREFSLRQLYLKFEGGNPTGTQKDRIAFAQAMDALRRGYDAITVATCGNYGAAVALATTLAGLRCIAFIPREYHTRRTQEMEHYGAEIVRVPGDYESAVAASQDLAQREDIYDANPGGANTALQLQAYGQIAYEIYDELRDAPAAVAVPASNGTTIAGVYRGFLSLYRRGKTSRVPRMICGSSHNKNPIIRAFMRNSPACEDLPPATIKETPINEPLINWHSIDGDQALEAVRATGGWAAYASDKSMRAYSRILRDREGLSALPASTAGLSVLIDQHRKEPLPGDRYAVILTGRK
jgi:threonine synthase